MQYAGNAPSKFGLENHGLADLGTVYWHLTPAQLYEEAIRRNEAVLAAQGPLVCNTGEHTGRSPKDKFIVRESSSERDIFWNDANVAIEPAVFDSMHEKLRAHLRGRDVFVFDGYVGADKRYGMNVRIVTDSAWRNLFAYNMFIREYDPAKLATFKPEFTVLNVPSFEANPATDGTRSKTFIFVNFGKNMVLIGGTGYAGEIKKSIFSTMNYFLPKKGIMPMHCSANYGVDKNDSALFFGLSGTGKTTLSADPNRALIGDDEHGWSDEGIFNFEGGCYAKVIRLDPKGEPEIYQTTRTFGTILENVVYDPVTRELDLDDDWNTENTRSSYPLDQIPNADLSGIAGNPKTVIFLTADAYGVLPPISKLTKAQAMYHFISGYTAKVAGTEKGVKEPSATFSACFGKPFMPMHPGVYAKLLGEKIEKHGAKVFLVNTGWTGGPYGIGSRMSLKHTRRMVTAALTGELDTVETSADPFFGLHIPKRIEGIPDEILNPRNTWADKEAYDTQAKKLTELFRANFKDFEAGVDEEIRGAGPLV